MFKVPVYVSKNNVQKKYCYIKAHKYLNTVAYTDAFSSYNTSKLSNP